MKLTETSNDMVATHTPAPRTQRQSDSNTTPAFRSEPEFDFATVWKRYSRLGPGTAVEEEIVEQFLPLVRAVVGRVAMSLPSHVSGEDLYSAGLVGLLNALRRFNPKSGASFETYARVRIRGAVFDELRRLDWVPRSIHDKARKVEKVMRELEQRKGKAPSDAEMAKALKISVEEFQELAEEIKPATFVCLDSVRGADADDGDSQYESVADETQVHPAEATMAHEMAHLITERLDKLPEMQRKVLALYYFEDLRLREIADRFGVTESRICQIHSQAILALKIVRSETGIVSTSSTRAELVRFRVCGSIPFLANIPPLSPCSGYPPRHRRTDTPEDGFAGIAPVAQFPPMPTGSMTWRAMSGSGARIGIAPITTASSSPPEAWHAIHRDRPAVSIQMSQVCRNA